jgi:ketohexokinase
LLEGASLICTWGDKGSAGFDGTTETFFQCAPYQPPHVVDTLGAGDTFTASVIATLIKRPMTSLEIAAKIASKIAGAKVGQLGYGNLRSIFEEEIKVVA